MFDIRELVQRVVDNAKDVAFNDDLISRRLLDYSINDVVNAYESAIEEGEGLLAEKDRELSELHAEANLYLEKIHELRKCKDIYSTCSKCGVKTQSPRRGENGETLCGECKEG